MKKALSTPGMAAETPLRVRCPSTGGMSSSSQRYGANPHNVRKSVFGSGRYSAGRPSMGLSSRRSSTIDCKKDIRSQVDRSMLPKFLQTISNFLQNNNYPYQITSKMLNSPTAKDVTNMFEFIIKFILVDFQCGKKFEDEFPRVMKLLLCPYNISKRNLQPVASLHNWQIIACGLCWLCDTAQYHKELNEEPLVLSGEGNESLVRKHMNEMSIEAYNLYMTGVDEMEEINEKYINDLPRVLRMENLKDVDDLRAKLSTKEVELAATLDDKRAHLELEHNVVEDIGKLSLYLEEVQRYISTAEREYASLQKAQESYEQQIADAKTEIKSKEEVIKNQRMSPEDVYQLSADLRSLTSQISACRESHRKAKEELAKKDVVVQEIREKVLAFLEEYHSLAATHRLTPMSAPNAQGFNYSIPTTNFESDVCYVDIQGTIGRLKIILKQWKEATRENLGVKMRGKDSFNQMNDEYIAKKIEILEAESQVNRQRESLELTKQELAKEVSSNRAQLAAIEEESCQIRKSNMQYEEKLELHQAELNVLNAKLIEKIDERDNAAADVQEFLLGIAEMLTNHKRNIEEKFRRFEKFMVSYRDACRLAIDVNAISLSDVPDIDQIKKEVEESTEIANAFNPSDNE